MNGIWPPPSLSNTTIRGVSPIPFNGSGTYSAPSSPGAFNTAISGQVGDPTSWNALLTDIQSALSTVICKDGQTTVSANIPMATFKFTGLGNGSAATDSVALGQLQSNAVNYALTTGTDTVLATLSPAITAYAIGQTYQFKKSAAANTTAVTLNINSVGAGAVVWPDGTALVSGDIPANAMFEVIVQATTPVFHLQTVAIPPVRTTLLTTRGDIITRGASVAQRLALGTSGYFLKSDGTDVVWSAASTILRSYLAGLTLSAAGATATFGIAAGQAADSTNTATLALASAYTKTTSAWALGTAVGALDTGAIANSTWYHVFLIQRVDTSVVDVLFSLSVSAPTMPTNYTLFRRIGSMKTDGSAQWVKFIQDGDYFAWDVAVLDVNDTNPGTSAVTKTLASVPTGVNVMALFNSFPVFATTGTATLLWSDLAISDQTPSYTAAPLNLGAGNSFGGGYILSTGQMSIRTNTSAQIRYKMSASGASDVVRAAITGWRDRRGQDA